MLLIWYSSCPAWCFWCWHARCSDIPHVCHVCCRRRRCVGCALFSPLTPPGERTQGHILLCFPWTTQISLTPSQSISSASHPPLLPLSITSNPVRLEDFERSLAAGRNLTVCLLCHVRWDDLIFLVQSGWVLVRPASFLAGIAQLAQRARHAEKGGIDPVRSVARPSEAAGTEGQRECFAPLPISPVVGVHHQHQR